jgi:hypothetical protein
MIGCKWQAGCSSQCENQIQMKSKSTKQLNSLKGI